MSTVASPAASYALQGARTSLDSLEGVPDWFEPRIEPGNAWQQQAQRLLSWAAEVTPGVALATVFAFAASFLSRWLGIHLFGLEDSPVSPILAAAVLGLVLRNTVGIPTAYERGLRFCMKTVLRTGIVLLGLRLSIVELGKIGLLALPIIGGCIAAALAATIWLGRVMRLPVRLCSLIAVGTSICGVSAIVATAPVIDAEEDEVSYAVGCITLFGLIGFLFYPFLAHWLFDGQPRLVGMFLGTAIHDTSQVTGAGLAYQQQYGSTEALNVAVVSKLVRNISMAAIIPLVVLLHNRHGARQSMRRAHYQRWRDLIPLFVLLFIAMVFLRAVGDWTFQHRDVPGLAFWQALQDKAKVASVMMLILAMAAVGAATGLKRLRLIGLRPMLAGLAAAAIVAATSFVLVSVLAPHN